MSSARGVLDDAWQKQQTKTFTAWVNAQLAKSGLKIDNIGEDFKDGVLLLRLLETIAGVELKKPEKGKLRLHRIQNLNYALQFIKERKVPLTGISAEELNDGNLKLTLGLIWMLILKFQIEEISVEELTAKEGLLLWCQKNTRGYQGVNVQNFHKSFQDGLAFCALISKFHPSKLDFSELSSSNKVDNLNLAFQVAEEQLGIPRLLDAQDMVEAERPDERSVMTYVAAYYHAFASSKKVDIAADRVGKVLNFAITIKELQTEFESGAADLQAWILGKIDTFNQNDFNMEDITGLQNKLNEYRTYRQHEKAQRSEEKGKIEFNFNQLQLRLKLNNRPVFVPKVGQTLADIDVNWNELERVEKQHIAFVKSEISKKTKLEEVSKRLKLQLETFGSWVEVMQDKLESTDVNVRSLSTVMAYQKQMELLQQEIDQQTARFSKMSNVFVTELKAFKELNDYVIVEQDLVNGQQSLQTLNHIKEDKVERLQELRILLEKVDTLKLEFALNAANVRSWISDAKDGVLLTSIRTGSVKEAEELHRIFGLFKNEVDNVKFTDRENLSKSALYTKSLEIHQQLEQLDNSLNEYSSYSVEELKHDWKDLEALTVRREQELLKEIERQHNNELLVSQYNVLSKEALNLIDTKKQQLKMVLGTSEEQKTSLAKIQNELLHEKAQQLLAQADELHAKIDGENINVFETADKSAYISSDTLHEHYDSLVKLLERQIGDISSQIATRDMTGISDEQLLEYKSSFNHFDKQNQGHLDRLTFRACLLSLGVNLPEVKPGDNDQAFEQIMQQVDKNQTGTVQFESLVDYMAREATFSDTKEQVLESFRVLAGDKANIMEDELTREFPREKAHKYLGVLEPFRSADGSYDYEQFANEMYN